MAKASANVEKGRDKQRSLPFLEFYVAGLREARREMQLFYVVGLREARREMQLCENKQEGRYMTTNR